MRNKLHLILASILAILVFTPNTFAQDSPQWHLPEGAKARLGKGSIFEIAYSPDGTRLAVAGSIGIWLYDTQTGEELNLLTGHTGGVSSVAFSPDGNTIASGSYDDTVRLWDANTGRHIRILTGHTFAVFSMAFSPDGSKIASGGADGTVLLWELMPSATTHATVSLSPTPIASPAIGQQLTLSLKIADAENVAGYQATVSYDTTALRYVESANADYLSSGAFFIPPVAEGNTVTLAASSLSGESDGDTCHHYI